MTNSCRSGKEVERAGGDALNVALACQAKRGQQRSGLECADVVMREDRDREWRAMPLLVDAKAAAVTLGLGARTLWALTKCRAIPSRKIGRSVRYLPVELEAWVAAGCPTEPGAADQVAAVARLPSGNIHRRLMR